jgi:subtilisin family serine protease
VCWGAEIMPVRIGFGSFWTQDDWIVTGITGAADLGADVISCSWGGGVPSALEQGAVLYATTMGRGGLGTAVFASTGNGHSGGWVTFPAAYPEAIAVGASSPCDERKSASSCDGETWWSSQWGPELDLVAPGPKVMTTDNVGAAGATPGNFVEFSGTSSACPHAAGSPSSRIEPRWRSASSSR